MSQPQAPYTTAEPVKRLKPKQQIFVDEYLKCFNAAEAARRAGYSEKRARIIGAELVTNRNIKEQVTRRLQESQMSADEALARLADMARGDIGDLLDNNGLLDIREARAKGLTKLIKKIRQRTITKIGKSDTDDDVEINDIEFEMYSAKDAIDTILKAGGRLKETEITIKVDFTDD